MADFLWLLLLIININYIGHLVTSHTQVSFVSPKLYSLSLSTSIKLDICTKSMNMNIGYILILLTQQGVYLHGVNDAVVFSQV